MRKVKKEYFELFNNSNRQRTHKNNNKNLRERWIFFNNNAQSFTCFEKNISGFFSESKSFNDSINWLNKC